MSLKERSVVFFSLEYFDEQDLKDFMFFEGLSSLTLTRINEEETFKFIRVDTSKPLFFDLSEWGLMLKKEDYLYKALVLKQNEVKFLKNSENQE